MTIFALEPAVGSNGSLEDRAAFVAGVAARFADDVDVQARFPSEAVEALRYTGLLGASVGVEYGGEGLSLDDLATVAATLGAACSSTGMIFAMHHSQVLSLSRHVGGSTELAALCRRIVDLQLLLASATTEIGTGGDVRSSTCFVERTGERITLVKNAPVISYGTEADLILVTARRTADSAPDDQVLLVCDRADTELEPTGGWDTLGMRGTSSRGYRLSAQVDANRIIPDSYDVVLAQTMGPVCHALWAAVWLGMSRVVTGTARRFVQAAARRSVGTVPPGAIHLVGLVAELERFEQLVGGATREFEVRSRDRVMLNHFGYVISVSNLKVTASTLVADIVSRALAITGISGYRNDGQYSVTRVFRDAHAAAIMVSNDRAIAHAAQFILVQKGS